MSCHKATWPGDCPLRRAADGSPLVPCEVCVHAHGAQCVSITGAILGGAERLVMTQRPGHTWIARLLLPPGHYTAQVHIQACSNAMLKPLSDSRKWNVALDVPALQADAHLVAVLRLWLRDPTERCQGDGGSSMTDSSTSPESSQ